MKKLILFFIQFYFALSSFSQVAPQTGSAVFNLPIFNWNDDKSRLTSNISLDYSSGSGLKVADVASNLGTGWSFTGGGVINRLQVGQPDDQKPYFSGNIMDPRNYPAGYLYNPRSAEDGCPRYLARYPIFGDRNHLYRAPNTIHADREQDYFTFDFNGKKGMFVIPYKDDNKGLFLHEENMKVWFDKNDNADLSGFRTTITAFYILDNNGLVYTFSQIETTQIQKYSYCDPKGTRPLTQPTFKSNQKYYESAFDNPDQHTSKMVNSWFLKEIRDSLTHRSIYFNYTIATINARAGINLTTYNSNKNYSIVSYSVSKTQTPQLSSIDYPDGHQVLIGYGKDRADLNGAKAISYIDVKYQGRYLARYDITTSYFVLNRYGSPSSDYEMSCARLCLVAVKKHSPDLLGNEEPYRFDYYMGAGGDEFVPPPFFYAKDIWGYYNGNNSKNFTGGNISLTKEASDLDNEEIRGLCFQRNGMSSSQLYNAKSGYAKFGLLKQIVYPTGGALKYDYEQNQYNFGSGLTNALGVHVSKTTTTDNGFSNDCNNAIVTNYTYNASEGSSIPSLWGVETPNNETILHSVYTPESKYFSILKCDYRYRYPGILARDQAVSLTTAMLLMEALSSIMDMASGVMTVIDIVNLCTAYSPLALVAVVVDVAGIIYTIIKTCASDGSSNYTVAVYPNTDNNSINPLPAQFSRVEITQSSGGNGKTVMEFTSPVDDPLWEPTNPLHSMKQRFGYWSYGLPKRTTLFDASGFKVKETYNKYSYTRWHLWVKIPRYSSCKCQVLLSHSKKSDDYFNVLNYDGEYVSASNDSEIKPDFYYISTGFAQLDSVFERVYKPNSSSTSILTISGFSYNNSNHQIQTATTTHSNGDVTIKNITYSADYGSGAPGALSHANVLNIPISTSTAIKIGGTTKYLGEKVIEFSILSNGDIKPYRTLEQRFNAPQTSMDTYRYPGSPDNPAYAETQTYYYDASANLIGIKDEGGRTITNIYDYNDKYVVASVINCTPAVDKAAYTSFETTTLGGWSLSGTSGVTQASAVTGKSSFTLSGSNSLSAPLNTAKAYTVSFWSKTNSVTVSGGTLVKSAPLINSYTYYEYKINQGASSVTIAGTGNIDELRLYPGMSRMRTVTYDPIIGKTSECDENNRIIYYEYENLGRLRFIKDEYRNVVKMYEYNTVVQKSYGCNTVYYNTAISTIVKRNNCSVGYIGSAVTYTIPANKYSSTTSQFMADLLAEVELLTLAQNYANTNGSCTRQYTNAAASATFTRESCDIGSIGGTVTYSVPAGVYTSTISQADADQQAQDEIEANGQAYANQTGSCTVTTDPIWQSDDENPSRRCEKNSSNTNTGYQQALLRDVNPNSATYNQTSWINVVADTTSCPLSSACTNCSGEGKRCINGICETGVWQKMGCEPTGNGSILYYRYKFSDGSFSAKYQQNRPGVPCEPGD